MSKKVVVVGAGIVGVSIAEALARKGVAVTLLERDVAGSGTSSTSYAWINSNNKKPDSYYELNLAGLRAHQELAPDGADWVIWGGHVEMAADGGHLAELSTRLERLEALGYPLERLEPEADAASLGDIRIPGDAGLVVRFPEEGYCYPALYIAEFLHRARAAGVVVREGEAVVGLEEDDSGVHVRLADGTSVDADDVVVAAGRFTGEVAALAGATVPMATYEHPGDVTVGYLATTEPLPARVTSLVTSPWLNVRPAGGGRLMLQALDLDLTAAPESPADTKGTVAESFLTRLADLVPNSRGARLAKIDVGQRVMPADGLTIVGRSDPSWLYVVATHSGVTLAPFLGEAVSEEVLGRDQELLTDFRPSRFSAGTKITPARAPRRPGEQ
ncbi:NAD(P)/FAD-dependent oxidoreductase [Ornithinimicrobium cerasi]|uniref:NAD(P)/FAD-dependent oxidoreductase n=1 Tax=Ornithinimicrobium cerasi TaxID=2248773 RepID=UPI000EFDEA32|nr:FAD-dependent oxidoreductase [Ornithinimicrobium cerasi]